MTLRVAKYAVKAQLRDASTAVNANLDQLVIASLLPASQLAYYAVAVSVTGVLSIFPMAIQIVSAPQIAGEPDETKRQRLVQSAVGTLTRVSVPLGLIAAIALPIGTRIILGPEWDQALKPELILIAAGVVLGFKNLLASCAAACGDPWLASRAELLGVVVTALGLALPDPRDGYRRGRIDIPRCVCDRSRIDDVWVPLKVGDSPALEERVDPPPAWRRTGTLLHSRLDKNMMPCSARHEDRWKDDEEPLLDDLSRVSTADHLQQEGQAARIDHEREPIAVGG